MTARPWPVLAGSAAIVLAAIVVASSLQPAAKAGGRLSPPLSGECVESPASGSGAGPGARRGSSWTLTDRLDPDGSLAGRQLAVSDGRGQVLLLDLPVESAVRGPVDGLVVVATDDGWRSQVRLISAPAGCSWLVADLEDIVRSAIYDPVDRAVILHVLDRATRADRGVWWVSALAAADEAPARIAPPPGGAVADLGPIWVTELRLEPTGRRLAIQSCSDRGCVTRILDLRGNPRIEVIGQDAPQGALIGFGPDRLVTWARCPGLPCPVLAWELDSGAARHLTDGAVAAALTADGRYLVMVNAPGTGRTIRVDLVSGAEHRIRPFEGGALPLAEGSGALAGLEVAPDEIAIAGFDTSPLPFRPAAAEAIR